MDDVTKEELVRYHEREQERKPKGRYLNVFFWFLVRNACDHCRWSRTEYHRGYGVCPMCRHVQKWQYPVTG